MEWRRGELIYGTTLVCRHKTTVLQDD